MRCVGCLSGFASQWRATRTRPITRTSSSAAARAVDASKASLCEYALANRAAAAAAAAAVTSTGLSDAVKRLVSSKLACRQQHGRASRACVRYGRAHGKCARARHTSSVLDARLSRAARKTFCLGADSRQREHCHTRSSAIRSGRGRCSCACPVAFELFNNDDSAIDDKLQVRYVCNTNDCTHLAASRPGARARAQFDANNTPLGAYAIAHAPSSHTQQRSIADKT